MTIQELINILEQEKDKTKTVYVYDAWNQFNTEATQVKDYEGFENDRVTIS